MSTEREAMRCAVEQATGTRVTLHLTRAKQILAALDRQMVLTPDERDLLLAAAGFCSGSIGRCDPLRMDKAVALITRIANCALAREKAEPVAWQVRRIEIGDWSECTKEFHDKVVETGRYYGTGARAEARALYLHPTAPAEADERPLE